MKSLEFRKQSEQDSNKLGRESLKNDHEIRELVMVEVIFRHGARHSMSEHLLENKHNQVIKESNKGQLSEIGMRQLYLLGQSARREYVKEMGFLSETYDRTQIHIQSSNRTRALESAQCFMFGLYPLGTGKSIPSHIDTKLAQPPNISKRKISQQTQQKNSSNGGEISEIQLKNEKANNETNQEYDESEQLDESIEEKKEVDQGEDDQQEEESEFRNNYSLPEGLYPFAIQTFGEQDQVLNPSIPLKSIIMSHQLKENESQIGAEIRKYSEIICTIAQKLHLKVEGGKENVPSIKKLYDIITCQKYLGHDYGVTDTEYRLLMYLKSHNRILELYTPNYSWVIASPLLEFIFQNFDAKIHNTSPDKLLVASTHDSQIVPLLVLLGLISPSGLKADYQNGESNFEKYPPFAANFAIELYKVTQAHQQSKFAKAQQNCYEICIKYNGNYIFLLDNKISIEYQTFRQLVFSRIATDQEYFKFCGHHKKNISHKKDRKVSPTSLSFFSRLFHSEKKFSKTNIFLISLAIIEGIGLLTLYKLYKNKQERVI